MRDSFLVYKNTVDTVRTLSDKEQLKFYNSIFDYIFYDKEPELTGHTKAYFDLTRPYLDSNNKRYVNGCKGGRPKDEDSPRKIFEDYETVILTESQWEKIVAKRGEELALAMVKILDNWLSLNGTTAKQYVGKNNYGHFKGDGWVLNEAKKLVEQESASKQPNWSV